MKTLLKSPVIVLAATVIAAPVVSLFGSSFFNATLTEAAFAAFASASLVFMALADYSYSRPRDTFASRQSALRVTQRQLQRAILQSSGPRVASLTADR